MWAHQAAWRRSVDSFWAAVWPGSETVWMPITSAGQTSHALRSIGLASCRVRGDRWVTSHTTAAGGRVSRQSRHCGGQGSLLGQTQHRSRLTRMHMPFISSHCTHGGILVTFPQCVETLGPGQPVIYEIPGSNRTWGRDLSFTYYYKMKIGLAGIEPAILNITGLDTCPRTVTPRCFLVESFRLM